MPGEKKKKNNLPVPVHVDMQRLVGDCCMPVDVDAELGMLVTIGIVVIDGHHHHCSCMVGWLCVCVCTAVQLSAGRCGGDHCHHRWVD